MHRPIDLRVSEFTGYRWGQTPGPLKRVIAETNLARNLGMLMRALAPIARLFTKTIAQGAATQCYLAAHPEVDDITGQYFSDYRIAEPSPAARDDAMGERLWALSEQLVAAHRAIEPVR